MDESLTKANKVNVINYALSHKRQVLGAGSRAEGHGANRIM